jgi:hypothetical protein
MHKVKFLPLCCCILFFGNHIASYAQESEKYVPYWKFYISLGAGPSYLNGLDNDIHKERLNNVELGTHFEKTITPKFSAITGLEYESIGYSIDGILSIVGDVAQIELAPNSIKYSKISQQNLTVPIQARFYFIRNNNYETKNAFIQAGLKISQNLSSRFSFRENGQESSQSIRDYTSNTLLAGEFSVGFKGAFFDKFVIINGSSFGFAYQFTPLLSGGDSQNIRPMHLVWRFLF